MRDRRVADKLIRFFRLPQDDASKIDRPAMRLRACIVQNNFKL